MYVCVCVRICVCVVYVGACMRTCVSVVVCYQQDRVLVIKRAVN